MNFVEFLFEDKTELDSPLILGELGENTYAEVYRLITEFSSHLMKRYGSGHTIALLSENSLFFVVAYFGILRSGNTAVLLDTKASSEEIATIITNTAPVAFCLQKKYPIKITDTVIRYTEDDLSGLWNSEFTTAHDSSPDQCAVIIFTSGSTGAKKGVMLSHSNLIANTSSIISYLHLTSKDRICVVLPFFYCYGASLLHTHIRAGGNVVLGQSIFLGSVMRTITRYQCTGFAGVPSTYQILIAKTQFLKNDLPTLRYFTQAGGHLAANYINQITQAFPGIAFYVMYGATEATARLSYLPPEELLRKSGSIGKGLPGVILQVHNAEGCPVLPGETGEIVGRGENIMLGYFQDPEETQRVLRNGWYHTGDLGTIDEDGYVYVTGRIGTFIKSAGFRVSPLEVEDTLLGASEVEGCAVIGIPHHLMGEAIVACVQSKNPTDECRTLLLDHCRRELPTHKVPVALVFVESIPLNSSGKPDRQALSAMVKIILPDQIPKIIKTEDVSDRADD